ncbi:MAG: VOC family protein [candidate division Zixibacteria bacterium]|jgi:predicted enzyme related to lactoylglutathione lyase|nr:VOC family protein [candidate division Zixibacteria bacterium]
MQLGNFSISLTVKDIHTSKAFYEKFGFTAVSGNIEQNWLVMKNGEVKIGLFQGMFDKNILTFNPGWDSSARKLDSFTDVRELQKQLKAKGVTMTVEADESTTGPGYFTTVDPDGNPILVDQHV